MFSVVFRASWIISSVISLLNYKSSFKNYNFLQCDSQKAEWGLHVSRDITQKFLPAPSPIVYLSALFDSYTKHELTHQTSVTFINQLMHSIITVIDVKILLYKSLKDTLKITPTCFGSHRIHHQGVIICTWLKLHIMVQMCLFLRAKNSSARLPSEGK